jgi:hypothetical protein
MRSDLSASGPRMAVKIPVHRARASAFSFWGGHGAVLTLSEVASRPVGPSQSAGGGGGGAIGDEAVSTRTHPSVASSSRSLAIAAVRWLFLVRVAANADPNAADAPTSAAAIDARDFYTYYTWSTKYGWVHFN